MLNLKSVLAVFIVLALSLLMVGCGLVGTLLSSTEIDSSLEEELPEWLTVAHRVQMEPQPLTEPEDNAIGTETVPSPSLNQPTSPQPGATQPVQEAPAGGTPRWQQPGTMEYIAKQRLDQLAFNYKRLSSDIADLESKNDKDVTEVEDLKAKKLDRKNLYDIMLEVAVGIGINLEKEYGIKAPPAEPAKTPDPTWFQNWEHSPTGWFGQ